MKYFVAVLIIIFVIGLGVTSCNDKKAKQEIKPEIETSRIASDYNVPQLTGLDDINYSIKKLNSSIILFIKTKSEYKELYTNKKFIIFYVGADCPYAKAFINAITPLTSDPKYSEKYNFYPQSATGIKTFETMEDAQADTEFSNICQEFCIVNPVTDQVFTINGIGDKEAEKIPDILDQLLNW